MKIIYFIILFTVCIDYNALAQAPVTTDSAYLFNQKPRVLDSLVRVKKLSAVQAFNIIEAKLRVEHYVSQLTISRIIYYINGSNPQKKECDSLRIFLCDRLLSTNPIETVKLDLLKLKKEYIEDNGCWIANNSENIAKVLQEITTLEYKRKLENDVSLLNNWVQLGQVYLRQRKYDLAENQFAEVLSYPFYSISGLENYENMDKCRKAYHRAGLGILDARRGNLTKLSYTFFVPAFYEILEPIKKMYIEELGGKYVDPIRDSDLYKSKMKQLKEINEKKN